ncbi:MAG: hypothetical protein RIG84_07815 [Roseovarius sp.]
MFTKLSYAACACVFSLGLVTASAALGQDGTTMGLSEAARADIPEEVIDGVVRPTLKYDNATVVTAGVGLRNRASGAIELGGLPVGAQMQRVFLYWNIITSGEPPAGADKMTIQRVGPGSNPSATVTGKVIGQGSTPCWGGDRNVVYRALVPRRVVNQNGTYLITLPNNVAGKTDGTNPWDGNTLPAYNGASLVAVAEGSGHVMIYEEPISGRMFSSSLQYRLRVPVPARVSSLMILHMINSDGQSGGANYSDAAGTAREIVNVNGLRVSGQTSDGYDSDWNGATGGRVHQLWDNAIRALPNGLVSNQARVRHVAGADCLVPVANVLETR